MADLWTKSALAAHVGARFPLEAAAPALDLELVEVQGLPTDPASEGSFSLLFRAPADRHLPQMVYRIRHPEGGAEDVFLVPIRRERDGLYMEAVFNRMSI